MIFFHEIISYIKDIVVITMCYTNNITFCKFFWTNKEIYLYCKYV